MNNVKHPLTGFSEDEQIEYLCVMASLMAADAHITDEELTRLREFCETLGISGLGIGRILAAAEDPSAIDFPAVFGRIARTDLRFALFADVIFMVYADGMLAPPELSEIHVIAARLGISPHQMKAISRYVAGVFAEQSGNPPRADGDCGRRDGETVSLRPHSRPEMVNHGRALASADFQAVRRLGVAG